MKRNAQSKNGLPRYNRRPFIPAAVAAIILATAASGCSSAPKTDLTVRWDTATEKDAGSERSRVYPLGDRKIALVGRLEADNTFAVESVEWFSNWRDGWTEASFFAVGRIRLEGTGKDAKLVPLEPLILQSTEKARIRYRDSIVSGDEAAATMDRRLLRAETAALALQERFERRKFPFLRAEKKKDRPDSFEYAAGGFLFPERYGYPEGSGASPDVKGNRNRGEGLTWDTRYSELLEPRLKEVRDTGTLWRDWEECAELFYIIYELERLYE